MARKCLKCNKRASFNTKGEKTGLYCADHKELGMIDVAQKRCLKCDKQPNYNVRGEKTGLYCADHKEPGMVDVKNKTCLKCDKHPNYNVRGEKKGIFCADHKEPDMVNVVSKTCLNCDKQPNYNVRGEKTGLFCTDHKEPGMINVKAKTCLKCDKQPNYNVRGEKTGLFCTDHKEPGMINVKSKTCLKCDKQPTYNIRGEKTGLFCGDHKELGMINVKAKTCLKCDKQPCYNMKGEEKGIMCSDHKEPGMVDVMNKTCLKCDKRPCYNVRGEKIGILCADHKESGMVDIEHKTCRKCEVRAYYGYAGKHPEFCYEHREINTIRDPRKRCLEPGCKEIAIYGIQTHEHCETHKLQYETNIVERKCQSCGLLGLLDKNNNCETCDPNAFKVIRLAKQNMVRDFLIAHGIPLSREDIDKMIDNGVCGKERPDFRIDCGTHILIIEVDEYQHSGRPCECEQTRMVNVSQSNGMPTIFLRLNPDSYKVKTKEHKMVATSKRLDHLLEWTKYHMQNVPTDFLSVMYLYFDEFEKGDERLETILKMEEVIQ